MIKNANEYVEQNREIVNNRFRGDYHLTPEIGWMNDPNGFVYYRGQYHLFYQYNPYDVVNAKMHWGHAVSNDLVNWRYLPVALAPDEEYDCDGCWSGSAIVRGDRLYLFYTGHSEKTGSRVQTQCLAWSDDGITFQKYDKNPIIGEELLPPNTNIADFRDPYVWEKDGYYYLLVGSMEPGIPKALTYRSADLFSWTYLGDLLRLSGTGYCWECPNLINLNETDVFLCSPVDYPHERYEFWNYNATTYATGKVNYETGQMKAGPFHEVDWGTDLYAAQAISMPDGTGVMTAWMNMWGRSFPTAEMGDGWTGSMILPREIDLSDDGILIQRPVRGISAYYCNAVQIDEDLIGEKCYTEIRGRVLHLSLTVEMREASRFEIQVFAEGTVHTDICYDRRQGTISMSRENCQYAIKADPRDASRGELRVAEYAIENDLLQMEIFLDKSSVELFLGDGELTMTMLSFNDETADNIVFLSDSTVGLHVKKDDIIIGK